MSDAAADRLTSEAYWHDVWVRKASVDWDDLRWVQDRYHTIAWDRILRRRLPVAPGRRFIEVGCGTAKWLIYYHKVFGYDVTGLDYSEAACESARRSLARSTVRGSVVHGDLFKLEGPWDVIASHGLIEHFAAPDEVLAKFHSILRPGGTLISMVPNLTGLSGAYHRWFKPETFETHRPVHLHELRTWYESLGLANVEVGALGSVVPVRFPREALRRRRPGLYRVLWPLLLRPWQAASNRLCTALYTRLGARVESHRFSPYLFAIGDKR